ncbi:unnamed protein product [Brassicogethes aeneus]|uniref:Uncharacterized protein n=1 Tax=Brassicogethes aeneus TaxID=1431903 RepID=A0A9P0FGM7_BRAAE|nr:unnamed protein product [Brassicogethes aeneus]
MPGRPQDCCRQRLGEQSVRRGLHRRRKTQSVYEGLEFITADNVINEEKMKAKWASMHSEAEIQKEFQKCLVKKETAVETSWAMIQCELTVRVQIFINNFY